MSTNLDPHVYAIRRTAIAGVRVPDQGVRVYFQDFDGHIREVQYKYAVGYLGGDKGSIIQSADYVKYHGPLAAVVSKNTEQSITLFYISRDNFIRGVLFNGSSWNPFITINQMEISVCPASQLATVRFNNDSELRLFYQDQDKNARELRYSDATEQWTQSNFSLPALVGSSLATEEWANDDGSLREVMFFYQDSNCEVRSHFYIAADDQWNYGYLHVPNMPPQCGIATAAHRHLGYGADVSRIYTVEPSGKMVERSWRSDTEEWSQTELVQSLLEGKIAATVFPLNNNPEIRLFYQGVAGELKGYNFQNRVWHHEHNLPCGD